MNTPTASGTLGTPGGLDPLVILDMAEPALAGLIKLITSAIAASQASEAQRKGALLELNTRVTGHIAAHLALVVLDTKDPANLPPPAPSAPSP